MWKALLTISLVTAKQRRWQPSGSETTYCLLSLPRSHFANHSALQSSVFPGTLWKLYFFIQSCHGICTSYFYLNALLQGSVAIKWQGGRKQKYNYDGKLLVFVVSSLRVNLMVPCGSTNRWFSTSTRQLYFNPHCVSLPHPPAHSDPWHIHFN